MCLLVRCSCQTRVPLVAVDSLSRRYWTDYGLGVPYLRCDGDFVIRLQDDCLSNRWERCQVEYLIEKEEEYAKHVFPVNFQLLVNKMLIPEKEWRRNY